MGLVDPHQCLGYYMYSEIEQLQVEQICDLLLSEAATFQPFLFQWSLSTWSLAVTASAPCVAWVFHKYHVSLLFIFSHHGISGPQLQHIPHKSGHHCPDLQEDTEAL